MQAHSLLLSVRAAEARLEEVPIGRIDETAPAARRIAGEVRATLRGLVEQLYAAPAITGDRPDRLHDEWVDDVLVATYRRESIVEADLAEELDCDDEELQELVDAGRIDRIAGRLVVPVGPSYTASHRPGHVHNWRLLVEVLDDVLERLKRRIERVHDELLAVGAESGGGLLSLWTSAIDRIEALQTTLRRIDGAARIATLLLPDARGVADTLGRLVAEATTNGSPSGGPGSGLPDEHVQRTDTP